MKNLIVAIVITFSGGSFAMDKGEKRIMKCVRRLVEKGAGQHIMLEKASYFLSELREKRYRVFECKKYKSQVFWERRSSRLRMLEDLRSLERRGKIDHGIKYVLNNFINPEVSCDAWSAGAHVALGVGIGTNVGVGLCKFSNGRKAPLFHWDIQLLVGIGVDIFGELRTEKQPEGRVRFNGDFVNVFSPSWRAPLTVTRGNRRASLGLGLGYFYAKGVRGSLALNPVAWGSDFTKLLKILKAN